MLESTPFFNARNRSESASGRLIGKRAFDLVLAVILLCLLLPLLVVSALLVRITSPGPVLFRQVRVGRFGRPFVMYKFRTMYEGSSDGIHRAYVSKLLTDEHPPAGGESGLFKLEADPRVTRVGGLLRRTSLDELPQLLNVVRGDMSLVGPRPALPWEVELMGAAHERRLLVPPGLTGLWQVSGRNFLTMREGLALDLEYVRRQGFWFDLVILLKTVPVVLFSGGAR
jgi:lipopolysaccharide/colanic/teichoic acid biosynthesis glycosyltransferase